MPKAATVFLKRRQYVRNKEPNLMREDAHESEKMILSDQNSLLIVIRISAVTAKSPDFPFLHSPPKFFL